MDLEAALSEIRDEDYSFLREAWNDRIGVHIEYLNSYWTEEHDTIDLADLAIDRTQGQPNELIPIHRGTTEALQDASFYDEIETLIFHGVTFEDDAMITRWPRNLRNIYGTGTTRNLIAFINSLPSNLHHVSMEVISLNDAECYALRDFMVRATQLECLAIPRHISQPELIYNTYKANPNIISLQIFNSSENVFIRAIQHLTSIRIENKAIQGRNSQRREQMRRNFVLLPKMSLDAMRVVMSFVLECELLEP